MMKKTLVVLGMLLSFYFISSPVYTVQRLSESRDIFSPVFQLQGKYTSMQGPFKNIKFYLHESEKPELLWITGYQASVVGEAETVELSDEFMCHSNLDIDMKRHRKIFNWKKFPSRRLFTLSQGQLSVKFPEGYGIPIMSNELLFINAQVLNVNYREGKAVKVRIRNTVEFIRDEQTEEPYKPLFMKAANGLVLLNGKDGFYGMEHGDHSKHGHGSPLGVHALGRPRKDKFGREFSGHWVVPPGRHVYHTLVTKWISVPFDTTVHYIASHLHPFAELIELKDLTTGETIFRSEVENKKDTIGLVRVESFSSREGKHIFKNHDYELVSVYNNTSAQDQTVMAVMFLYMLDKEFKRPVENPVNEL